MDIKTLIVVLCNFFFIQFNFGQSNSNVVAVFTSDWKETDDESKAYYYRVITKKENGLYDIQDLYYKTNTIQMKGSCISYIGEVLLDGMITWYYENGVVSKTANYRKGKLIGELKEYYENGSIRSFEIFKENKHFICQRWDEDGNTYLRNGNGSYSIPNLFENNNDLIFEVKDSIVNNAYAIRLEKNDTLFLTAEKQAEYKGGMVSFYKQIASKIRYPADARRNGAEGKVFVQFVIDKNGIITEPVVIKGIGFGCDEEAINAIKKCNAWIPATYKGEKVKSRMVIPINFNLANR